MYPTVGQPGRTKGSMMQLLSSRTGLQNYQRLSCYLTALPEKERKVGSAAINGTRAQLPAPCLQRAPGWSLKSICVVVLAGRREFPTAYDGERCAFLSRSSGLFKGTRASNISAGITDTTSKIYNKQQFNHPIYVDVRSEHVTSIDESVVKMICSVY